jgi:CBS-domain-containing membrane protein
MEVIKAKFKKLWKYYILQSLLAGFVLLILVLILGEDKMLAISAMGGTAFIVFAMPRTVSAQTRHVVGGHLVGLLSGFIFFRTDMPYYVEYPMAIALVIFLMVALDVEHPPAAGTTLAVLANEVSLDTFVIIIIGTIFLSQCRYYLRRYLKDLI